MPEIFTSNQIKKQLNIQFYGPAHSTDSAFWVDSERLENEAENPCRDRCAHKAAATSTSTVN